MRRRRVAPEPASEDMRPPMRDRDVERLPPRYYAEEPRDPRARFEGFDAYNSGYTARVDRANHGGYGRYDDYDGAYQGAYEYDDYDEPAGYDYDDYEDGAYEDYDEDPRAAAAVPNRAERAERRGAKRAPERRPAPARPPRGRGTAGRTRRRFFGWLAALSVIAGLSAAIWFGSQELLGFSYDDYEGAGVADVVVKVSEGDSTSAIASTLAKADVVASEQAFLSAAQGNTEIRGIQPGFYKVRAKASGANALNALLDEQARVGHLQLKSGSQLHDVKLADGERSPGILSTLSTASCAKLDGTSTCVSADELLKVAANTDLPSLGVPEWLARGAADAPGDRRLEGLIAPGLYDVKPGWSARELLTEVLSTSASRFEAAGLPGGARQTGYSPYEIVVIASVVEREGVTTDFGKISRVIYNRLGKDMRLEMDSTINYVLDKPNLRTSGKDRAKGGPYNTYRKTGLPPGPISSPSMEALQAAQQPANGSWLYFVRCEKNGMSCFANNYDKHRANVADAQRRGVW